MQGATPCALPCRGAIGPAVASPIPGATLAARWAPIERCNVERQRTDPGSMLCLARDLIALRRRTPELQTGRYETMVGAPAGVWAWRRGDRFMVALNLSDDDAALGQTSGRICIATDRGRDGERFDEGLPLPAWEGVIAAIR